MVAGMRCGEVLEVLSEFLDGELNRKDSEAVVGHLRGCDWCERFGGSFSSLIAEFRQSLAAADMLEPDVESRLLHRLERDINPRSD